MNSRALWMLAVSVFLGIVVTFMAVGWVAQKGAIAADRVVVAAVDIELGSRLTPQMLSVVDWPRGSVPHGTFTDMKEVQDRVLLASLQRGEAVLGGKLAPVGTLGGLSAVIAEGKRAMTVRVNDVVGVAGFALPGNYVDVMVNMQQDRGGAGSTTRHMTRTVLERVLVLAIAQEASRDETKPKVVNAVTLELTPADAEKLDLARNVGTLSLVLRNQMDKQAGATTGITKLELFGEREVSPPRVETVALKVVRPPPRAPAPAAPAAVAPPAPEPVAAAAPALAAAPVERTCVEVVKNNARALSCF